MTPDLLTPQKDQASGCARPETDVSFVTPNRTFRYSACCSLEAPDAAVNAIVVIAPYKYLGMWVFDDARVGLVQEPFVGGADVIIERAVESIPYAEAGFVMLFSSTPFPGHQFRLSWRRAADGGNYYYSQVHDMEGWLCPALFKYFDEAPKDLYFQVKPK
jgi:Family of unknown function (DUF6717)